MARQAHGIGTSRVLVVTEVDQLHVVAYYAWCMASVAIADLPEPLRRGAGRYPQPIALLLDVITHRSAAPAAAAQGHPPHAGLAAPLIGTAWHPLGSGARVHRRALRNAVLATRLRHIPPGPG